MSTGSAIEWTESTWNPVVGCTRVSAGCDNCYAVKQTFRLERMGQAKYADLTVLNNLGVRHFNGKVRTVEAALDMPLRWGKPRTIFVNSMSDLFHRSVPIDFIDKVFAVMLAADQHRFQILTKRPERMRKYVGEMDPVRMGVAVRQIIGRRDLLDPNRVEMIMARWEACEGVLPNVALGTSVESNDVADRIEHLRATPAALRFLSCEPLLGPVDVYESGVDWVIAGGESGPRARPCDLAWIRGIASQCALAGIPVFVKQLGARPVLDGQPYLHCHGKGGDMTDWPNDLRIRQLPNWRPHVEEFHPAPTGIA